MGHRPFNSGKLVLALVMASLASADELKIVDVSLSITGTFSAGLPADLAFDPSRGFTGTTDADGFLRLNDLGTFILKRPDKGADVYHANSDVFTLDLVFSSPAGVEGSTAFDGAIHGNVNREHGSVSIDFGPSQSFAFSNLLATGSFDVVIDDLTLQLPDGADSFSQVLTGSIKNAWDPPDAVPEPDAVVLFGTVLLLAGSAFGRLHVRRS